MAGSSKLGAEEDGPITDINVTPLVDITLVLLIIFMVTTSIITQPAIKVDLPEAANADENPVSTLGLLLTRDGKLYLNGDESNYAALDGFVRAELGKKKALQAVIQADRDCRHGEVIHLIDVIKGLGVSKFALNIEQVDVPAPPPAPAGPAAGSTP